ncbi:hypothetical protein [Bacillus thuringiensis]|uniref:hypothetical protein n=1 Tax=Bacillus thuringiensis TaxID=1428 RepID=UPI00159C625C|nr:hypothetical protein [Bacillus thuringiensis]
MASTRNFSSGYREIGYRFELLDRDLNIVRDVTDKVKEATVENNSFVSVNRTAKFTIKEDYTQPATILSDYRDTYNQGSNSIPFDSWTSQTTYAMKNLGGVLAIPDKRVYSGDSPEFDVGQYTTNAISGIDDVDASIPTNWVLHRNTSTKTQIGAQSYTSTTNTSEGKAGPILGRSIKFHKYDLGTTLYALIRTTSSTPLPTSGTKRIHFCGFFRSKSLTAYPDVCFRFTGGGNPEKFIRVSDTNINKTLVSDAIVPDAEKWYYFEGFHDLTVDGTYTIANPCIGIWQGASGKDIEYDQFYYDANRTSRYSLDCVSVSPVINCSIADALGVANQLKLSLTSVGSVVDRSSRRSGSGVLTRPASFEINWSRDGGATWLGWQSGTSSLIPNWDMRNFRFQLRLTLGQYTQTDPFHLANGYQYRPSSLKNFTVTFGGSTNIANPNYDVIDYTKHRIKPYLQINNNGTWTDYPLGVFLLNSAKRQDNEGGITREVDGYDQLVILSQAKLLQDLTFYPWSQSYGGQGETGGWAVTVKKLLQHQYRDLGAINLYFLTGMEFLVGNINIPDDDNATYTSRGRNFKAGTTWLEVLNELLRAGGYTGLWCDRGGNICSTPYVSPDLIPAKHTYIDDETSIIFTEASEEIDTFETANVFKAIQRADYEGQQLESLYMNENDGHPSSIPSQQRYIVDFEETDSIETQAELDNYVYRKAFNASQVYGQIHFMTALDPNHEDLDNVYLRYQDLKIDGLYTETAWTMHLTEDPYMEHRLRRIVSI